MRGIHGSVKPGLSMRDGTSPKKEEKKKGQDFGKATRIHIVDRIA
jgi:hypothetical protein